MGKVIDSVVSFIGRPFGIYTHDEVFSDIQIINLLTPDKADSSARKAAIRTSGGDAKIYHTSYRTFQRQYKRRYSKKFLENLGYAPSSTASTRVIDNNLLKTHLQNELTYSSIDILNASDIYLNLDKRAKYGRQFVTNYDHMTATTTISGKIYDYSTAIEVSPTEIQLRFVRNFNSSIIDNLTNNYSYDSINNTVVINSELYSVGTISSVINNSDEYETICTHQGGTIPDETILTSVERYNQNYINELFDNECTYVEYKVTSGEIDTATRYYIKAADTLNIYTSSNVDVTAIVPMKENNVIANEDNKLKRMLKKLNLSYDQLIESLENPDMDSAYLMTGLNATIDNPAHNKVLFNMFDILAPGSGNITVAISHLSMTYTFTVNKANVTGNVSNIGGYTRSGLSNTGITLRYQGSATEYQEIVITNFNQRYVISGQVFNGGLTNENTRLIIPLDIFNNLSYREWTNIYERSLCMLGYSMEVVEVKWYETSAFGFLLQIIGIVFSFITGGLSLSISSIVKAIVINFLISQVVMLIANMIGGELGAIIGAAIGIYLSMNFGGMKGTTGSEMWLKAANEGLNSINQFLEAKTNEKLNEFRTEIADLDKKIKEITEDLEEQEKDDSLYAVYSLPFNSLGRPNRIFQSTEDYVNSIVNTEWLVDGKWLYDIDGEIASRNSVYVG